MSTPASLNHHRRRAAQSYRFWTNAAVALAIAVCVALALSHFQQERTLARVEQLLARVRDARIGLANGFLNLALADTPLSPFRRETGQALVAQALADLETIRLEELSADAAALQEEFARVSRRFRAELAEWTAAAPPERADIATRLRISAHQLDQLAEQIGHLERGELETVSAALNQRFTLAFAVAVLLLGGICGGVYLTGRSQKAAFAALLASEERLRFVSDSLPDSYLYHYRRAPDGSTHFDYLSAGFDRVHGLGAAEVLAGKASPSSTTEPHQLETIAAMEARSARDLTDFAMDFWIRRTDGERRLLQVRSRPQRLPDGTVRWAGVATDITERRRTQEALEEQNTLLRSMSAIAHVGGWAFDPATGEGTWTEEVARIHDMDPAVPTNQGIALSVFHDESRARIEAAHKAAVEWGQPYDLELEMITPAGHRKRVRTRGEPVLRDGRVVRLRGSLQDITQLHQAQEALRQSEARFRQLFEQAGDGIFIFGANHCYEAINPQGLAMVGYTRDELLGRKIGALTPPERLDLIDELRERMALGQSFVREWPLRRKDGSAFKGELNVRRLTDGRMLCILRDLSERTRQESRTALQHTITRILADGAPLATTVAHIIERFCAILDWHAGVLWLPDRATKQLRCACRWHAPLPAADTWDLAVAKASHAPDESLAGRIWRSGRPLAESPAGGLETAPPAVAALPDALGFPIVCHGETAGVLEFRRLTARPRDEIDEPLLVALGTQIGLFVERQNLEQQMRQSQKMEALGTMAGGIAHDFNNILAAIVMNASLAQVCSQGQPEVDEALSQILLASRRATDLVRQILTFSRRQEQQLGPVQLRHLLGEAARMLRATVPSTIEIKLSTPSDLPPVLADATQVQQVMMNLGNNAGHAMRDRPGVLAIAADTVAVEAAPGTALRALAPGRYVRVAVSDTGHGMDTATQERIFEPFFTTKAPGEGTGLGLAVVHGIMLQHRGAIAVHSTPGVGSNFELFFPVAPTDVVEAPRPAERPRGAGECILVIDDEVAVAHATAAVLTHGGYRAEAQTSAQDALDALRLAPERFALVLTDHTLPGYTGLKLAEAVRAIRPGLPVILTTGNTHHLTPERLAAAGVAELLPKPLTPDQLLAAIRRVLERAARPPA